MIFYTNQNGSYVKNNDYDDWNEVDAIPEDAYLNPFFYSYIDGEFVFDNQQYDLYMHNYEIEEEISKLKSMLLNTDYVVIKIAEGSATIEEYDDIINSRRQWREHINELEEQLYE